MWREPLDRGLKRGRRADVGRQLACEERCELLVVAQQSAASPFRFDLRVLMLDLLARGHVGRRDRQLLALHFAFGATSLVGAQCRRHALGVFVAADTSRHNGTDLLAERAKTTVDCCK